MRKILYVSGTRADYGLMRKTLMAIDKHPELDLTIVATGMHLMPEFGESINEIKQDGFQPLIVDVRHQNNKKESLALFFSDFMQGFTSLLQKEKPDLILLLGDRGEMLAGAIAGVYFNIPVAHLHGGEISGHVDDKVRYAITQLAQIHLPATEESAQRIISLGEDEKNVYVVGAPGLVGITEDILDKKEFYKKINLPLGKKYLIILQHPVHSSQEHSAEQIELIISAAKKTGFELLIGYPNADSSSNKIIEVINSHKSEDKIHIFINLTHKIFISAMKYAEAIIGNSSGAIIEAASFQLPVVNVGDRQKGRQRSDNTIDVDYDEESITAGINEALSDEFKKKMMNITNVYGDGKTSERVAEILSTIKLG